MKVILDLCGGTGSWSKPYKDAGYEVILCTLPHCDVETCYFENGYLVLNGGINGQVGLPVKVSDIYGILAAPPCTMFSLARRTAKTPPDFDKAMATVEACLDIIWECRKRGSLKFWALENPVGLLRQFLGKPPMTIEQWWFGDGSVKRSDIWGYYNEPRKVKGAVRPTEFLIQWQRPPKPAGYEDMKLDRAAIRAITPQGFAQAFYKANQ